MLFGGKSPLFFYTFGDSFINALGAIVCRGNCMQAVKSNLLRSGRFLPLFIVQFIGAFCDNIFRNALLIYIAFRMADSLPYNSAIIVGIAGGVFILPYFLFSATAGQLADRYEKSLVTRRMKLIEIALVAFAGFSLFSNSAPLMMAALFLLGIQSTFFGTIKYSILPKLLRQDELVAGNGFIEAGTFVAILLGSITGGLLVIQDNGPLLVLLCLVGLSFIAWLLTFRIPSTSISDAALKIDWHPFTATWPLLKDVYGNPGIWRCIMGISWLWFVGSVFLSMFPNYVKQVLHAEPEVATMFMAVFSIGIAAGSVLCAKLQRGEVTAKYVPAGAMGMAVFAWLVFISSEGFVNEGAPHALGAFMLDARAWPIIGSLFFLAASAGVFSVPLYALLQARSEESHRARIVAANNIINALGMVIASGFMALLISQGFTIPQIFLSTAIISVAVAAYVRRLVKG